MQFWSVANYALAGLHWSLSPRFRTCTWGLSSWPRSVSRSSNSASYSRIEGVIATLVLAIFASYLVIVANLQPPLGGVALGFVPTISGDIGYLTMIISLVGTTVYYPNFFIQTSMQHEKDWTDVSRYRKDHTVGLAAVVALSATVIIAAAIAVPDETLTLTAPAEPLTDMIGPWVLGVFVLAVGAASFTSATGTLFAAGFMLPSPTD